MSSYTTNLNLIKPDYDDDIDVQQLNNNSDVIDTQITDVINVNNNQNTQINNLSSKIDGVVNVNNNQNKQINNLSSKIDGVVNVNNNQNKQIDSLSGKITGVVNVNNNQNKQIDNLSGRVTTLENKKYPYLPLTGGNLTGELTVNGKTPQYELERWQDNSNENYTLTAIKYSNGVLEQVISCKKFKGINEQVTFLFPFKDTNNISLSNGTFSLATDEYKEPYNDWVWSVANLSATGAKFKASGYYSRPCYTVKGYWK